VAIKELQRRLASSAVAAAATALTKAFGQALEGRPVSYADILAMSLGIGLGFFLIWPALDRRWAERERAEDPKRFALMAGGLALGAFLTLLPGLTGTGAAGDFAVFVGVLAAFAAALAFDTVRRRPPAG
jgi:hypothetical protein